MASKELVAIETPADAIEALRGNLVVSVEDPQVVARRIMESILDAEDVDGILGQNIAVHAADIVGRGFTLNGVKYMKSRFKEGLPVFAVMDATFLDDGSTAAVTSSARNVCAQAAMLWKLGAIPIDVVIRRSDNPSEEGNFYYWLEKA